MPDANNVSHDFFLGQLLKAHGTIHPACTNLHLPPLLLQFAQLARTGPVTREAGANPDLNGTFATAAVRQPFSVLGVAWETTRAGSLPALPTLNKGCPHYSTGSHGEDVRGG